MVAIFEHSEKSSAKNAVSADRRIRAHVIQNLLLRQSLPIIQPLRPHQQTQHILPILTRPLPLLSLLTLNTLEVSIQLFLPLHNPPRQLKCHTLRHTLSDIVGERREHTDDEGSEEASEGESHVDVFVPGFADEGGFMGLTGLEVVAEGDTTDYVEAV